jgi:hypothetical protein
MGSRTRDSEAQLAGPENTYEPSEKRSNYTESDKPRTSSVVEEASLDHSLRYYGLSDSHMVKSGATTDDRRLERESRDGGIMRTTTVEQHEVMR